METMGQIFGKENEFIRVDSGSIAKTISTTNTTIGTNTMSIAGYNRNRSIEGGRITYYPQSDLLEKTNTYVRNY